MPVNSDLFWHQLTCTANHWTGRSQSSLILHCSPTSFCYFTMINAPALSTAYTTSCLLNVKTFNDPSQVGLAVRWSLTTTNTFNVLLRLLTQEKKIKKWQAERSHRLLLTSNFSLCSQVIYSLLQYFKSRNSRLTFTIAFLFLRHITRNVTLSF